MKTIYVKHDGKFSVFSVAVQVRKVTAQPMTTLVHRPDKGGGYRRREKFQKRFDMDAGI